jgi:hypothetical protein
VAVPAEPPPAARAHPGPGDALLHPISLLALGVLLLNDHVLKSAWPGPITGKLSDLAGMVFFPILLVSAAELAPPVRGSGRGATRRPTTLAVALSGAGFVALKTLPDVATAAGSVFGIAQWTLALPVRLATGASVPAIGHGMVVTDPTDLIALPCLAIAAWIGLGRVGRPSRRPATMAVSGP